MTVKTYMIEYYFCYMATVFKVTYVKLDMKMIMDDI